MPPSLCIAMKEGLQDSKLLNFSLGCTPRSIVLGAIFQDENHMPIVDLAVLPEHRFKQKESPIKEMRQCVSGKEVLTTLGDRVSSFNHFTIL
jgi:hypothetical protein